MYILLPCFQKNSLTISIISIASRSFLTLVFLYRTLFQKYLEEHCSIVIPKRCIWHCWECMKGLSNTSWLTSFSAKWARNSKHSCKVFLWYNKLEYCYCFFLERRSYQINLLDFTIRFLLILFFIGLAKADSVAFESKSGWSSVYCKTSCCMPSPA